MTPLPTTQVAVLMGVRLAEPIAYTVIFPFINEMIEHMGVTDNPDRIGFFSGLVESAFAFVQVFTVYHWAKLSDRIGRKPVILCGLVGVVVSTMGFGLANSFWTALLLRSFAGAWCGNVAVVKASLGDITDETNSTEAFALYGLTWTVGSILGNALGGGLARPADKWGIFDGDVWRTHPYFLPCLVAAASTLVGIVFAAVMFRESLPGIAGTQGATLAGGLKALVSRRKRGYAHSRNVSLASDASEETLIDPRDGDAGGLGLAIKKYRDEEEDDELEMQEMGEAAMHHRHKWGFWDLVRCRRVQVASSALFLNSFVAGSWAAGSLLFFYDRRKRKQRFASLSRTGAEGQYLKCSLAAAGAIGGALAINGLWSIVCQLLLLTRLRRALGLARAYQVLTGLWVPVWWALPQMRTLLEALEMPDPDSTDGRYPTERGWPMTIAVNVFLSLVTLVALNNSLLMVVVNDSAPDRSALGAVNGISTAVGCMARVIGPSLVSALFAISMDTKALGGRLWWIFMVGVSIVNLCAALLVRDANSSPTASAAGTSKRRSRGGEQLEVEDDVED